jgi:hypothetical protein
LTSSKSRKKGRLTGSAAISAKRLDEAAKIPGVLLVKLCAAGVEQLAAGVGEGGGDQRVAGSEVVDEHP